MPISKRPIIGRDFYYKPLGLLFKWKVANSKNHWCNGWVCKIPTIKARVYVYIRDCYDPVIKPGIEIDIRNYTDNIIFSGRGNTITAALEDCFSSGGQLYDCLVFFDNLIHVL